MMRRHSANCVSMLLTAAMRSGSSASARQCSHQTLRSSSDGVCLPCSILLTLEDGQPVSCARSVPDRPASLRMSRRRTPKDARAWSADVVNAAVPSGDVLSVGNCPLPHLVTHCYALPEQLREGFPGKAAGTAIGREDTQDEHVVIEQPEVLVRELDVFGQVTGQVADVLARRDVERRNVQTPADVVGMRAACQPHPLDLDASRRSLAHEVQPVLVPGVVVWLTAKPPAERLVLGRYVVRVSPLQVERPLSRAGERLEVLITHWLHVRPSGGASASWGHG